MKKVLKIIGITLSCIFGSILLTIGVIIWCIFTPERLTPMVKAIGNEYISCDWEMGNVELTFFSTFPEFGLHVDGLCLINPMEGAPSDTILITPSMVAKVDAMAFLKHKQLIIHEIHLPDVESNLYVNAAGENNFSVFHFPQTNDQDTTSGMPFDSIAIHGCVIEAKHLSFIDEQDSIYAVLNNTQLAVEMTNWDAIQLQLSSKDVSAAIGNETYANHVQLAVDIPASINLDRMSFSLHQAQLAVNEFALGMDGNVTVGDSIYLNMQLEANNWAITPAMNLLPLSLQSSLTDLKADGLLSFTTDAKGIYSSTSMPVIDAHIEIQNGQGSYTELPYVFNHIHADLDAHLDLNQPSHSTVSIHRLDASTKHSQVALAGNVTDCFGEQYTKACISVDASLPDWSYFMPTSLTAKGQIQGDINVDTYLSDILNQHYNRCQADAHLNVRDFDLQTDSMHAQIEDAKINVDAQLTNWPIITASIGLDSKKNCSVQADSLDITLLAPSITAYASVDTQDTTHIPTFLATVQFDDLKGYYTTYKGHIGKSKMEAKMTNSRRNNAVPVFNCTLSTANIQAHQADNHITTQNIEMDLKALYNRSGSTFLLQWNPVMRFFLNNAEADISGFEQHIRVPQIMFNYSNREFNIINSYIQLGHSDFALSGQIHHIGKWLQGQDQLTGELNFTSNHTDVNELMQLFSADSGSEENAATTQTTDSTAEPFLVPNDVDLTLTTNIQEAVFMDQTTYNLGGKVYVRDGILVLEELGFICDAAKLQLTAMYRTPRRDHIYLGFDYHMLDVKIDQLINMIPQVDSMMPMLRSFKGDLEFHLAAETYLKSNYEIKTSTLRGACSIFGKDLVVMDSETFDRISKILLFNKKTENRVDSISAEITLSKNVINVYPFCVSIDNYMAALGGKHNLDMSFDYHINLLSPFYIGVDITGNKDELSIKPGKCIYAKDFRPIIHNRANTQNTEFRQLIRDSLRKNVQIK